MKSAVTGAAGFIGSHLVESLLADGHEVLGLDRPGASVPDEFANHASFTFVEGDVRDDQFVTPDLLDECEVVYHLASLVGVTNYLADPFGVIDINILGTRNVVEAVGKTGAALLFASTSEIYGKNPKVPWAEDDDRVLGGTQVDRWSYSTSKAAAEHLVLAAHKTLNIPVTVVRYFNAYGPRQAPNYVISKTVHNVLNGKRPLLYDTGDQTRCFTYVSDIIEGTVRAATVSDAIGEVFNLGSTVESSIVAAIELVINEAGSDLQPEPFPTNERYGPSYQDVLRRVPDVTKARTILGWSAATALRKGVRETIDWARTRQDWLSASSTTASAPSTTSSRGE